MQVQENNHMYDVFTTYTLKLIHAPPLTQPHMDTCTHAHTQFNRMLLKKRVTRLTNHNSTTVLVQWSHPTNVTQMSVFPGIHNLKPNQHKMTTET